MSIRIKLSKLNFFFTKTHQERQTCKDLRKITIISDTVCDVNCPQLFSSALKMVNYLQHKDNVDSTPHFTAQSPVLPEYNHTTSFNFS